MAEIVPMPKLGFDMTEGKLVRKVVPEGQPIKKGEILAEVETDKATIEVEAYISGVVKGWLVEEGQSVPVGANMVVIAAADENVDINALRTSSGSTAPAPSGEAATQAAEPAASTPKEAATPPSAPAPKSNGQAAPAGVAEGGFLRISPIARRMADELGIDPRQVKGTGPEGRITKKDIEAYAKSPQPAASPTSAAPSFAPISVSREDTKVPLTKLRSAIARRMTGSKTSVPHFYVTSEIDMGPVMELRKQLNTILGETIKLSVNDFIVKAAALALRQFPGLNASFSGDTQSVLRHGHINVGNAVSVEAGLLTVVVRDADLKSLSQISTEVKAMAARAREGKVKPDDVDGSTFTISNLGMYDVDSFVAIINPPDAAILAVGSASEVPVVVNGQLAVGWRMKATISADHRATDGAEAAQFMQALKKYLEEPLRLVV